jgi:TPR repeat protein
VISVAAARRLTPFARPVSPSSALRPPASAAPEIAAKMKIGAELMATGDVTAARMMFERAAEAGEATAAFALAETYDPAVLRRLRLRGGISPDVALARRWYEKARDLGSIAAPERIVRLTQIPQ